MPGSSSEKLTGLFVKSKETANTIRFAEVTPPGADTISAYVYVTKRALKKLGNPQAINVSITAYEKENDVPT